MYPTTAPRLVIRSPNPKSGFNIRGGGSSKHPVCTVYPSPSLASDLASVGRAGGYGGVVGPLGLGAGAGEGPRQADSHTWRNRK